MLQKNVFNAVASRYFFIANRFKNDVIMLINKKPASKLYIPINFGKNIMERSINPAPAE